MLINPTALEAGLEAAFLARTQTGEAQAAAFERFAKLRLPNRRVEGWKWSDFNNALRNFSPPNEAPGDVDVGQINLCGGEPVRISHY